jgi:hypothetical protein
MVIKANSEPVQWEKNGHWYQAIDGSFTWIQAFVDAKSRSHDGLPGHLATLTSPDENDFVWETFQVNQYWLGGFQFRQAKRVHKGWFWINGEPWVFANWGYREPNDWGGTIGIEDGEENFLQLWNGQWNDENGRGIMPGYIIEYEEILKPTRAPIMLKDIHRLTATWGKLKQSH